MSASLSQQKEAFEMKFMFSFFMGADKETE